MNNREQFAADLLDSSPQRAIQHLRVDIQRGVDVRVTHELCHDVAGTSASASVLTAQGLQQMPLSSVARELIAAPRWMGRGDSRVVLDVLPHSYLNLARLVGTA